MTDSWHLQAMTFDDLDLVKALLRDSDLPDDDVASHYKNFLLAFHDGKFAGCVGLESYQIYGLFRSLAVKAGFRNLGLGAFLTASMLGHARDLGIQEIFLLTTTAEAFFPRFGFQRVHRETAPSVIQATTSFSELCPSSATLMSLALNQG